MPNESWLGLMRCTFIPLPSRHKHPVVCLNGNTCTGNYGEDMNCFSSSAEKHYAREGSSPVAMNSKVRCEQDWLATNPGAK